MTFPMMISAGIIYSLIALPVPAQDKKPGDTATTQVTGCLAQAGNTDEYTIRDEKGQAYNLQASTGVNLKAHVGHKVTISGTRTTAKDDAKARGNDRLMVTNLTMVSANCS